jgi:hypothetical protein
LALCQNCLQKLSWHFAKTASKNYAGTLLNCLNLNIAGTFENCREKLFPTPLNAALFHFAFKGLCRQFGGLCRHFEVPAIQVPGVVVESLIAPHALRQLFCIEAGPIPLDGRRVGRRRTDGRDDGVVCRRPATRASSGVASSHGFGRTSWRELLVHSRVEWTGFKLLVIPFFWLGKCFLKQCCRFLFLMKLTVPCGILTQVGFTQF